MNDPVVTAKFKCISITPLQSDDPANVMTQVQFMPVYAQEGPNASWSKATPAGEIKMLITNPKAVDQFVLGREYLVPFIPAD